MTSFLENIELWLSIAGVLVVWLVAVLTPVGADIWKVTAITALAVGVLHGVIFWTVRRRQRRMRAQLLYEIREMLGDVIKNHLSVISLLADPENREAHTHHLEHIRNSIQQISGMVDGISEESLTAWKRTYGYILDEDPPEDTTPGAMA